VIGWFLLGAAFGAFLGVVVMAMLAAASDADDWQEWHELGDWEGEGGVYDQETENPSSVRLRWRR
jgi:hypothetical protein